MPNEIHSDVLYISLLAVSCRQVRRQLQRRGIQRCLVTRLPRGGQHRAQRRRRRRLEAEAESKSEPSATVNCSRDVGRPRPENAALQYYYWRKCINCIYCFFQYITGSHYSRSTSHITVLRGSCLLYYRRPTCHCVCHFRSGLSATAIKEYCIVL